MDLYTEAAAVLDKFENKQGSVKSLVFATGYKNIRQLYALVCESLKYQPVLTTILERCHSLQQEDTLQGQGHLATVLLYEHLVGKGLGRAGQIRKCIVKHKKEIQEKCQELLEERGVTSLADLLSSQCQALNKLPIPRYVRVNLLKTTVQEAVAAFTEQGWIWRGTLKLHSFQREVESLGEESFGSDPLLPDLLVFPPRTDLHDHPWVVGGSLVLQDRASCFPAHVLNPGKGATVLDCCAAPGNKTSHAASLMGNTGKIWAYERDGKRMSLLQQQLRKNGVSNAKTMLQDFLSVNPHDEQFADVEYVLVDPSCSGSGIMSRMDHVNNATTTTATAKSTNSARLLSLQRFQISILKHALRFPRARRIVYSTCSIYEEENEKVVAEVAQQVQGKFDVKSIFPEFPHRGKGSDEIAEKCVRMSPEKDLTNGFFVACFERICAEDAKTGKSDSVCDSKGEIAQESTSKDSTVVSARKKKRKRKRTEESEHVDSVPSGGSSGAFDSAYQIEEHHTEPAQSPKKKKKKKHKSKKKDMKHESEGIDRVENGSSENQKQLNIQEVSSVNDAPPAKKLKLSKQGNDQHIAWPSESVQASGPPDTPMNTSSSEKVSAKKKKKKRDKKPAEQLSSPPKGFHTQESSLPTLSPDSIPGEAALKKKKKKWKKNQRRQGEQQAVDDHEESLTASQNQDTSPSKNINSTEQDSVQKHKKKKKSKKNQPG